MNIREGIRLAVLVTCAAGITGPAAAEIYKYVDEQGNVRFTDDPSKIPASAAVKTYARRAYACDNLEVLGGAPCFTPSDARYMTIALLVKPAGRVAHRLPDPGNGVAISVKDEAQFLGSSWLHVTADGRSGWIGAPFVRHR